MVSGLEQYIQFALGREMYAIHISDVHEIIKMQEIRELPHVMPYVKGMINLRGKIVPVISMRKLFDLEADQYTKHTRIVVVKHKKETVGMIVDRVDRVVTFTDIQPPPDQLGGIHGAHFTGIGISENTIVGLLKLEQVLLHAEE